MHALVMAYIGPRGIPRRHWLGGPPGWTQDDRDDALAWLLRERQRCSSCGYHPDSDPAELHAVHRQCPGCAKLETTRKLAEQRHKAKDGTGEQPGMYWALEYIAATARTDREDPRASSTR